MFDGLLGRSAFYTKCKSLIKRTRTRIEVVRRKRNATHKFLRKDIADLLANNLASTAFERADGLIAELILSSCYDFIDLVCEIVLKHLSVLQKLRECPEDCREAVASLMFAAARFSDLPELRDLRNLFQERYGGSLELYVNQKLAENISAKPPSEENKLQLLREIALEFSVSWDSRSFEQRVSNSAMEKKLKLNQSSPHVAKNKVATPPAEVTIQKTVRDERQNMETVLHGTLHLQTQRDSVLGRKDDLNGNTSQKSESVSHSNKPPSYSEEPTNKVEDHSISFQRRKVLSGVRDLDKYTSTKDEIQIDPSTLSQQKSESQPTGYDRNSSSLSNKEHSEKNQAKSIRKGQVDATDGPKTNYRGGVPPPYMKPRNNKHKADINGHLEEDDTLTLNPAGNGNRAEKLQTKADNPDLQDGVSTLEHGDGQACVTEIYYKGETNVDFTPRRRSHRRKHSRSSSIQDIEDERVLRRVSTSRRKHESRKGLQILVGNDDDPYQREEEEEKIIDKLLLHYSKKPSSGEPGKSKRKDNVSKSQHHKAVDGARVDEDSTPSTSRSFSLPSRQVTEPKLEKEFTRATSFQQDTPAKHVHPKLPNYDDLAARFAALRAAKS